MDKDAEFINIFDELKNIRTQKGISLETISKDSRIQLSYLQAIESGEFEKIPEVYDKLFFQTYLSYLNIDDPEKYMKEFKSLRKEIFYPTPTTTIQRIKTSKVKNHSFFNLRTLFLGGPIILLVIIIGFMAWNSKSVGNGSDKNVKELPVRKIVADIEALEKTKSEKAETIKNEQNSSQQVSVAIGAVDTTWLRFVKDNQDTTEYMLYPGNKVSIKADSSLQFLIGNASGLKFTVNGEDKGFLANPGEVISYMKITRAGIVDKRVKSISKNGSTNDSLRVD